MALIRIDHHPPRRQLDLFGLVWLLFFGTLGGVLLWQTGFRFLAGALWGVALLVPALGRAIPEVMRMVYVCMAYAAFPIGLVVSYGILLIVYYLIVTPTGLALRLCGYDPMRRRFDRQASSYWVRRQPSGDVNRYFRQF